MKVTKEFRIGIFVIGIFIVSYFGMNYLAQKEALTLNNTYYMQLTDASNLSSKTMVTMYGVKIGEVGSVTLSDNGKNVNASLSIYSRYKIPKDSYAFLSGGNVLDKAVLKIELGNNIEILKDKDTLSYREGSGTLMAKIEGMAPRIDSVISGLIVSVNRINQVLSHSNIVQLSNGLQNMNVLISKLNTTTQQISNLIEKNDPVIGNIMQNALSLTTSLQETGIRLQQTITHSDSAIHNFKRVSQVMSSNVEQGRLLRLIENDTLYHRMNSTLKNLDSLLVDIKNQPGEYVHFSLWGKKKKSK